MVLPNEILSKIMTQVDKNTINSINQIPELKNLISIEVNIGNIKQIDLSSFDNYKNIEININDSGFFEEDVYLKLHKVLKYLIAKKLNVKINYSLDEINLNYLKLFKSLFNNIKNNYLIDFTNLSKIKVNSNHLLINNNSIYNNLNSLNLYYCSSNFLLHDVFNNLDNAKIFPNLVNLKIQDYMNESEDVYLKTSDNYNKNFNNDDSDFEHNSDFDENEFYFDGLEILQNLNLFKLQNLTIKNCNLSILKNIQFNSLINLKIISINDKHSDAFDLITNDHENYNRDLNFKNGSNLSILNNNLSNLKNLVIIGNLKIKPKFKNNKFGNDLQSVFIKCVDCDLTSVEEFKQTFNDTNVF